MIDILNSIKSNAIELSEKEAEEIFDHTWERM